MQVSIMPRRGEQVVVVRSEGELKDSLYVTEYPDLQNPDSDVIVGRVTTENWMQDLNSVVRELEALGVRYEMTNDGAAVFVPEDSRLAGMAGFSCTAETLQDAFGGLMDEIQESFTHPTELAGRVVAQISVLIPVEEIGRVIGGVMGLGGGLELLDREQEEEDG